MAGLREWLLFCWVIMVLHTSFRWLQRPLASEREKREGKMEFLVTVPVDDAQFEVLERRYQTLIG